MEIRLEKNWGLTFRPSKSFKVIGTDTDRSAIDDLLLVIHNNSGPVSYHFQDKKWYLLNSYDPSI